MVPLAQRSAWLGRTGSRGQIVRDPTARAQPPRSRAATVARVTDQAMPKPEHHNLDAADMLDRLARAARFCTVVTGLGPTGRIEGCVEAARDGNSLTITERGRWVIGPSPGCWRGPVTGNVSRYTVLDDRIVVEHLRHGPGRAVRLLELACDSDHWWRSVRPHLCAQDRYSAQLRATGDGVRLVWTIDGPATTQTLTTQYIRAPEAARRRSRTTSAARGRPRPRR